MAKQDKKITDFFLGFPSQKYTKGKIIIKGGENPDGIYFLKKGYVRMYSVFDDKTELTLNIFKQDTFFPMIWGVTETRNSYYFQALTKAEVYKAPRSTVIKFLQKDPEIFYAVTKRIMIGLEALLHNIQYILFGSSYKRVAGAIVILGKRFGEDLDGARLIKIKLAHKDIATLAGLTRETTTLAILKLRKEKYISYKDGNILIINPIRLEYLVYGKVEV